jgi:hypothetical protein
MPPLHPARGAAGVEFDEVRMSQSVYTLRMHVDHQSSGEQIRARIMTAAQHLVEELRKYPNVQRVDYLLESPARMWAMSDATESQAAQEPLQPYRHYSKE